MRLDPEIKQAVVGQAFNELRNWLTYLNYSTWYESKNFTNIATYLKHDATEEMEHFFRFRQYLLDRGENMEFSGIDPLPLRISSPHETFQHVQELEEQSTKNINNLVNLAKSKQDPMTEFFLIWFVDKQISEEADAELLQERSEGKNFNDVDMFIKLNGLLPGEQQQHHHHRQGKRH
ncbi:hypothetical protein P9112_007988 [Eukaryota sp. TZLM1-RC]